MACSSASRGLPRTLATLSANPDFTPSSVIEDPPARIGGITTVIPRLRCECLRRGLLRSRVHRFVRRLHSYYDGVRLLVPVHHRLRLLAFPMRTVPLTQFPTARRETSQLPMRSFCT